MKKVIEGDFVVLYEDAHYWIIEDKVYSRLPVKFRGNTSTFVTIYIDFVEFNGKMTPARFYLPKNIIPLRVAMDHFQRLEREHKKRAQELGLYKQVIESR